MRQMFRFFPHNRSDFLKNTLTLMTGTTISQVIPIMTAPILTRIYLPQDYGILGIYLSVAIVISILSTLSYTSAILIPSNDDDAIAIVHLCAIAILIWAGISGIIAVFFKNMIACLLKTPEAANYFYFLPFSTVANGIGNVLSIWANRKKLYHEISVCRVTSAILTALFSICIGLLIGGPKGLFCGLLVSQLSIPAMLLYALSKKTPVIFSPQPISKILEQAKAFSKFPKYSFPAEFIQSFINQLPIYLLSIFAGKNEIGYYNLSNRILGLPIQFVGSAISDVFRQRASANFQQYGNCHTLFIKTFKTLIKVSFIPFLLIAIFSPFLFSLAFGAKWKDAGVYTSILSVLYFFRFINAPLSYIIYLVNKQHFDLISTIYWAISSTICLYIGFKYFNVYYALMLFSINYSLIYIGLLFLNYMYSKQTYQIVSKS
jgi:O-antigen/teichoic acid export membrane protein